MKIFQYYLFRSFIVIGLLSLAACDLDEANVNPNQTDDASINVILPPAQVNLMWAINDFASQSTSSLLQYMTGTVNVQLNVTRYEYLPANFNTTWNNHFYAGALQSFDIIIDKSTENEALHYRGISKIMTAMAYSHLVSLWGDVPFTEAINLDEFSLPSYDSGEFIYQEILKMLDEAIEDLNSTSSTSPSRDDLFYPANNAQDWINNSLPRWIQTANALKARLHNHLSKIDPTGSANAALEAIDAGVYQSNADHLRVALGTTNDAAGPWFNFLFGTFGQNNIAVNQYIIDMLTDRVDDGVHDPRLPYYISPNSDGEFVGAPNGSTGGIPNLSILGEYVNSPSAPTNLLTYSEVKFIEAEAAFRINNFDRAADAFNEAVRASIMQVTGAPDPAYEEKFASETAASIQEDGLEKIFTEKYIAMFLQTEAWSDWRRSIPAGAPGTTSGIPALEAPTPNGTNGVFPRRFLYPQWEMDNNSANVPQLSLTDRVFWDQ